MRSGLYAFFKGSEYRLIEISDGGLELISNDSKDIDKGFSFYDEGVFVKKVVREQLDQVCLIDTFALYKGVKLKVGSMRNGKVLLGTSQLQLVEDLGFDRTDKYFYEKWVDIAEVQLIEEKQLATI
ncbi:hypothetical protein [Cohnella panacarvi]|uniref:hypothetical protein n=1 Tax=Cohnella panacarvi TaxID=400776 RepID=UPI00047C68B2|nr:hypothetical protein [Cohnella panacarvi]